MRDLYRRFTVGYRRLFSLSEIEEQPILQWMFGASLFYFFITFNHWIELPNITVEAARNGTAVCWPYFQKCTDLYFLHTVPHGYSQQTIYMIFYGMMAYIVFCMWRQQWVRAHALMFILFLWKVLVLGILTYTVAGPYDYYHLILTAVLLLAAHKEYFLKVSFVFMYFMSATIKFSPAWVLGTYFTALKDGLPIVPDALIVVATNIVIFGQIVEGWFLLSKNMILQRIAFVYAAFFHLYSGIFVTYAYPSVALLPVLILFGPLYRYTPTPFTKKAVVGWAVIAGVAFFQLLGFVVSPDRFLTLEGHRYGMFMFEANHQCRYTTKFHSSGAAVDSEWHGMQCEGMYCLTDTSIYSDNDGAVYSRTVESASAWNRCDPYEIWYRAKAHCAAPGMKRIELQFDHSINGGPFYRIVDEASICELDYKPFSHNDWIKTPPEAPLAGYARRNSYQY
ncbi:MAG: hypothetical protein KBD06_01480 [Candidatus Pacebacteria bacterium]|nr:hypothetical protein [Candidatus Paceibacterota bacterium]